MKTKKGEYASALIKEISVLYTLKIKEAAEKLGIKNAYRTLLSQLYVKDGGTQLSLADKTGMKAPTISITLRKMEKDGLVDRVVDEKDLRKTHVYLTEKGRKTTDDLNAAIEKINDGFVKGMSDTEKDIFIKNLENIKISLQ